MLATYNSAKARRPDRHDWQNPRWLDFPQEVVRAEPVVVHAAMAFGLKPVSKALHALGAIQTLWADGSVYGLGAMVGSWWCQEGGVAGCIRSAWPR
jgi:hypothetical protein